MIHGKDYIGAGCGAIMQNDAGQIFMQQRGKDVRNEPGKWTIPGGMVEFDETIQTSLAREIKEEHGVDITVGELLSTYDHIIPEKQQHWITSVYFCTITGGEPTIVEPHKCDAIGWFSLEEMEQMDLTINMKTCLALLKEKTKN